MLPYPQFIIIGAPKCGTSWMQAALGQHPRVIVVPDEIEYFSSRMAKHSVEWYVDRFEQQVMALGHTKTAPFLVGEKSARYCSISTDRIREVHTLLPDARLVLMTRDPVDRHWSHARRYFSKPRIAEKEGGDVLSVPRQRLFDFLWRTRGLGEFSAIIRNWTTVYPGEQLLVVSQERTSADPRATFDAVLGHLGLSTDYDPSSIPLLFRQRNRGPTTAMPDDVAGFLEPLFAFERQRLCDFLGSANAVTAGGKLGTDSATTPDA